RARLAPQDDKCCFGQRLRHSRHHRRHPHEAGELSPGAHQKHRSGKDRTGLDEDRPAQEMDRILPPDHHSRTPGLQGAETVVLPLWVGKTLPEGGGPPVAFLTDGRPLAAVNSMTTNPGFSRKHTLY